LESALPFVAEWFLENHVVYVRVWGNHPIEEIRDSSERVIAMMDHGADTVHFIIDNAGIEKLPPRISAIQNALGFLNHPAMGLAVHVGQHKRMVATFIRVLSRIFRVQYQSVLTIQEAIALLQNEYPALDWAKADYSVFPENVNMESH
jgi:hypothetical protein